MQTRISSLQMQYRIWAEMINSGIYSSMEDPPSTLMFKRAGPMKTTSSSHSPAKAVDIRTKCFQQLADLNNLKSTGVLTAEEYDCQKKAIIETLNKL